MLLSLQPQAGCTAPILVRRTRQAAALPLSRDQRAPISNGCVGVTAMLLSLLLVGGSRKAPIQTLDLPASTSFHN